MRRRITVKQLEEQIKLLNKLTGNFDTPYIKNEETGEYVPQAHVFVLGRAYGGFSLEQMAAKGTGCCEPLNTGHIPARELHGRLAGMIKGMQIMQGTHHSIRNWMALSPHEKNKARGYGGY